MSLRAILSALVFGALLLPMQQVHAQTAPAPIRMLVLPLETDATAYYAADLGLFTKYGLNLELTGASTGAATAAAISGGAAEIRWPPHCRATRASCSTYSKPAERSRRSPTVKSPVTATTTWPHRRRSGSGNTGAAVSTCRSSRAASSQVFAELGFRKRAFV